MNIGFYKDLDANFELACELSSQDLSYEDIINFLKNGNIPEKQIAALSLNNILTKADAKIFIDNLTGCDGKIREAIALKVSQLLLIDEKYIDYFNYPEIFANATIDINANICRLVIEAVGILKINEDFKKKYLEKIINFIQETFSALDNFVFKDKKYVINKQLFKLYWCLEALKLFIEDVDKDVLLKILKRAAEEQEYTIREKVAQIVIKLTDLRFDELKKLLKKDENYYVKTVFY